MSIVHPVEYKSRLGGHSHIYCDIAEYEFSQNLEIMAIYKVEKDEYIRSELKQNYAKSGIKTIIFSALSLEAGINDYAAWQLGDSYFEKHLSSLDVLSKWIIIPNLICKKSIDKSGPAYCALKKLITARNELVHNKSKNFDLSAPNLMSKLEQRSLNFDANIMNSYRTIVLMSLTMDRLIGNQFNPLKSFDKSVNLTLEIPSNIVSVINDCKSIIA